MKRAESREVEDLLRCGHDTAGGIMVPDVIALKENVTAIDIISVTAYFLIATTLLGI